MTLWATTSTTSGSGDNGADPNQIVKITDMLGDTTLPANKFFAVFDPAPTRRPLRRRRFRRRPGALDLGDDGARFVGLGWVARRRGKGRLATA